VNLKEAELLFQAGALAAPVIKKYEQGGGWIVTLTGKHKLDPALGDCTWPVAGVQASGCCGGGVV